MSICFQHEFVVNKLLKASSIELMRGGKEKDKINEILFALESDNKLTFTLYGVSADSKYIFVKDKAGNLLKLNEVILILFSYNFLSS